DTTEPLDLTKFPELAHFEIEVEGIQEIYNCATPTSYKEAKKLSSETALTNSLGTKNILDIAKQYSAKMVHLSSSAVYGDPLPEDNHFSEDYWGFVSAVDERASYNEGKRFSETLCKTYHDAYGVQTTIARVFATYGPHMIMDEGRHVPDFISAAIDNKDIVIYGDKDTTTSFCFIGDMVDGLMKLVESKNLGPFNIGADEEYKLQDVAQKVIDMVGSKSKIKFEKPPEGMHDRGLPNIAAIKKETGWFPITKIEEGLKQTVEYMQSAKSHYQQQGIWDQSTLDRKE
ncbi:MAG: NAD-dependent epimerase/dehydratase family protein, partial [Candidatus Cloacimonetes bacterium]|nr:NAD-dependent epimerase/dehydratase family protein [Candidatus Cloacimonadota bacterium]